MQHSGREVSSLEDVAIPGRTRFRSQRISSQQKKNMTAMNISLISFISNLQGFGENIFIKPKNRMISLDHLLCIGCMSSSKPWKYPCWHRLACALITFPLFLKDLAHHLFRGWIPNAPKTLMVFFQWLFLVPLIGGRWYIITYHLLGEPETTIDFLIFFLHSAIISCFNAPVFKLSQEVKHSQLLFFPSQLPFWQILILESCAHVTQGFPVSRIPWFQQSAQTKSQHSIMNHSSPSVSWYTCVNHVSRHESSWVPIYLSSQIVSLAPSHFGQPRFKHVQTRSAQIPVALYTGFFCTPSSSRNSRRNCRATSYERKHQVWWWLSSRISLETWSQPGLC